MQHYTNGYAASRFNPLGRSKSMLENGIDPSLTSDSETCKGMQEVYSIYQFFEDIWRNFQRSEIVNNHIILRYTFPDWTDWNQCDHD